MQPDLAQDGSCWFCYVIECIEFPFRASQNPW